MTIQTAATQPTLTAAEVAQLLVQPLEQASTFLSAGPQIIDSAGPVRIPRIASGATAAFTAPGTAITESNVTHDEVQLLPADLRGIKAISVLSNELLRQATHTVGALDQVIGTRLVTDTANVLDAALWDGPGTSNTIKGILRQSGIQTGTLVLTDPDSLIDALAVAQGNFVAPTHWVMTPAAFASIRKVKVSGSDKRYVIDPTTIANGTAFQLFGLPVIVTANIPNASTKARVALVDFNSVVVARDQDPTVTFLYETYGDKDSVGVRVTTRYDVALTQPKAVTLLTEA